MKSIDILSTSSNQTMNIAKILAKHLSKGDTVVLTGELGSGKTKFTEGFLSYYGLEEEISSPTFNIVNEYITNSVNIYHLLLSNYYFTTFSIYFFSQKSFT